MTQLNEVQRKLAEQLLLSVKNKEMNVEYNELAQRITPPIHWRQVGKNIGEISKLCHELGLPLLSAKVVNKNSQRAGEGFYPLYELLGIPTEGKTEKELFRQERDAIRNCTEWYKLEDYLGLHIGFERPATAEVPSSTQKQVDEVPDVAAGNIVIPVVRSVAPPPPEYLKPDVHIFSVTNPTPFRLSVDVLNYGFGSQYVGDFKKGWQQAKYDFTADGTSYFIWFPKISTDGKPASTYGWINSIVDGGGRIIEEAADTHPDLGFEMDDQIRLVFPKTGNEPYLFSGVFLPDRERCTYRHHEYVKVADEADCTGPAPKINYFKREDSEDERLVAELRADALTGVPDHFKYQGKAKEKADPVEAAGRKIYPRDRQTSINALSHAGFHCEIDSNHPTFLRRNSSKPYTEPHHLIPMAFSDEFDVSLDVEENIVSLCSNCHNHIHYGQGADALLKVLYLERNEDLKRVGINITFEQLLSFYK